MVSGHGWHGASQEPSHGTRHGPTHGGPYGRLVVMAGLSFLFMYVLMYAMVDRFAHVYANLNQAYMAGLMTAPMVLAELVLMRGMYRNRRWNAILAGLTVLAGFSFWVLERRQVAIGDDQFLRSMIPHHGAALLMCKQASVRDPAILDLCRRIVAGQQAEIDEMNALLSGERPRGPEVNGGSR